MKQKKKNRKRKFTTPTQKKILIPTSVWNAELSRKGGLLNTGQELAPHTHKGLSRLNKDEGSF
jgi:hypothetical protein